MNYFIEGLQGSGKSTLVDRLAGKYPECHAFREGDYSPVELSWCAYMTKAQYQCILAKYPDLCGEIRRKSFPEDDRIIICYTQVKTDNRRFYEDLEQYEIYNNRMSKDDFRRVILSRYARWNGSEEIHECSLFQNIVEDMILFQTATDEEIIRFYQQISQALRGKEYQILYLQSESIEDQIAVIRKERSDDQGHELWFPMMCKFFDESPFAKAHGFAGEKDLMEHFRHRQDLELRLCREVFPGHFTVLKSKKYSL